VDRISLYPPCTAASVRPDGLLNIVPGLVVLGTPAPEPYERPIFPGPDAAKEVPDIPEFVYSPLFASNESGWGKTSDKRMIYGQPLRRLVLFIFVFSCSCIRVARDLDHSIYIFVSGPYHNESLQNILYGRRLLAGLAISLSRRRFV
jgi:hypothetical protein